ncbi:WecB/TagA/CpsF family glycosyltransferase [Fictibacillus phosphorivorans]|uniref:WecB/TagA/CpsF family glycosyltransferase n=1 Tax=Fictibacillus phosphorivorans TaxID=1221500 RepID=UPI00203AF1FA|nr:WecB/TagA/CpsF family glycosyltransferase [Fictibacillus phosphorivorans]MCM3718487.1 WecB/TagA/CpsF family glycosyltransferase [Fictibacillus phosphorivorans]MCM3776157.1 WecB/TagA/CpsF family glycosyltransferase [Fictibacillus phosphorivorans]
MKKTVRILGVDFVNSTLFEFLNTLSGHLEREEKTFVVTANPEIVMKVREDANYRAVVEKADYVTADGIGVVKAAGLLGTPLPERVTGFETFMGLLQIANERGYSVYLLGAQDEVLQKTVAEIMKQFPNVKIAGAHHGFFDWNDDPIPNEIKRTKPDLIFTALGVPRQELWIGQNMDKFEKGVFMGIGGSFDVLAGAVQRAPEVWQKMNLEWAYRLMKQPSRWKRQLSLPHFALKVIQQKVTGKHE